MDGQFSDADLNTEAWACSSPTCKNIFFPRRALGDLGKEGFKCWNCGLKAFSVNETDEGEIASALDGGVGVLVVRGATDEVVEDEVVVG